ncbi:MAG: N-acetylmuramoyl-L-alanine amidase [bacterium]
MSGLRILLIWGQLISVALGTETVFLEGLGTRQPLRQISEAGIDYLSASDLATALEGKISWSAPLNEANLTFAGHRLRFMLANPFCEVDGRIYNLVISPIYSVDDLYLPAKRTTALLRQIIGGALVYDSEKRSLTAVGGDQNVLGVYLQEKRNGTLLEIALSDPVEYEVFVTEGNWINVTIIGGQVDPARLNRERPAPEVRRIRAFQFENSAQVSVQMRGKVLEYHDNLALDPPRIQVSIEKIDFDPNELAGDDLPADTDFDPINVVIIDPGHGGIFDGAHGPAGSVEKELVLDIALRLEDLLDRDMNLTPVLTRRRDHTVDLEQRALTANSEEGDIFVSIHANAFDDPSANGCETYFLSAAADDAARVTEILENSDFRDELESEPSGDLDFIIMDMLQTEYLQQSRQLAESVQKELRRSLNIHSRGINQAGFVVLSRVEMPAILVEVAFISNKVEERLLGQEGFRQNVAEAIYRGILSFAGEYNRRESADARP